jgi:hypothetical protein
LSPPEGGNVKQKAGHQGSRPAGLNLAHGPGTKGDTREIQPMFARSCLAVLAIAFSLPGSPAHAVVCMDKSMTLEEVAQTIGAQASCERAMKVFQDCALTASGDVDLGAAVEKKCEADFMPGLKGAQKHAYQRQMRACDAKYRNKSGTMYLSFTAFCRAEVAQRFSQKALKAAGGKAR